MTKQKIIGIVTSFLVVLLLLTPISQAFEVHNVLDFDRQTTYYISDEYIEVVNTTGTYQYVYYYENDVLVGREDPDGHKFFYHPDNLGSTDLITNESGDIVEETTYEPYGKVVEGGESRFLFTHKELDDQTGLYYFGARYYDPLPFLFTQPDETITDIFNPQDLNRYAHYKLRGEIKL